MIRPIQSRMARAALGWTLRDLAERARVNKNTVARFEAGREILSGALASIEKVLTDEDVVFVDEDGDLGPTIRLKGSATIRSSRKERKSQASRKSKTKPKF